MTTAITAATFARGIAAAEYQTAGLNVDDASVVRGWRAAALDSKNRARTARRRDYAAGFVRGCSDWLHAQS